MAGNIGPLSFVCFALLLNFIYAARQQALLQPVEVARKPLRHAHALWDEASGKFAVSFAPPNGNSPASGNYSEPAHHRSNFGQLRISTSSEFSDKVQMQAAGFLEGYLTAGVGQKSFQIA